MKIKKNNKKNIFISFIIYSNNADTLLRTNIYLNLSLGSNVGWRRWQLCEYVCIVYNACHAGKCRKKANLLGTPIRKKRKITSRTQTKRGKRMFFVTPNLLHRTSTYQKYKNPPLKQHIKCAICVICEYMHITFHLVVRIAINFRIENSNKDFSKNVYVALLTHIYVYHTLH